MALKQRNTTRSLMRVGTWVSEIATLITGALKAFLDFKEEDGLLVKGGKTIDVAARRTLYLFADYGLWALQVALFTTMKTLGFGIVAILSAIWAFDFVAAGAFVLLYETTGKDLSLGADFRRAKDAVHKRSRVVGYAVLLMVITLAVVWTGPEKIITFFRREIGKPFRLALTLTALTFVQALIWTLLYDLGYGLVVELF